MSAFKPWGSALTIRQQTTRNPVRAKARGRNSSHKVSGPDSERYEQGISKQADGSKPTVAVKDCVPSGGLRDDDEALRRVKAFAVNVERQVREFAALVCHEGGERCRLVRNLAVARIVAVEIQPGDVKIEMLHEASFHGRRGE
ncbi:MAG: hypothetical protein F4110_07305 [Acidimicrobiaceae bacterium]|nr:hypothetical protein [Acidimicrobiaceae bacterium]MYE96874.1 hypothetical protein [Acidimicrobiaceae bacterium]MYI53770.1 hypothetical protein [Acidimicrobiaceae bacterium]